MNTNDRKLVSFNFESSFGKNPDGYWSFWGVYPGVTVRPTSALAATVGFAVNRNDEDAQWVRNIVEGGNTRYVFAQLDQTTVSMTTRVNYTITPDLSVQIYAQPFVSAGVYDDYKELVRPRADEHTARYTPYAFAGNADFNVLSFRTTNVMRWEYKPGSALFVVWQRGHNLSEPRGGFDFSRDFGDVFSAPSTNTLLVKLAYWFNP